MTDIKRAIADKEAIADKLYEIVIERFNKEQPQRNLTENEKDSIWFKIYGKLCRGETEDVVTNHCKTIPLNPGRWKNYG